MAVYITVSLAGIELTLASVEFLIPSSESTIRTLTGFEYPESTEQV